MSLVSLGFAVRTVLRDLRLHAKSIVSAVLLGFVVRTVLRDLRLGANPLVSAVLIHVSRVNCNV